MIQRLTAWYDKAAALLRRTGLLRILEYSGFISVMFAVFTYFHEAPDRKKQKHYQAWQVINTAQGKGGSGGRIEAMQELNMDHEPLVGVDASGAFLQAVRLAKANLVRADFQACDLRDANFDGADLRYSNLQFANFRGASLKHARLGEADLGEADLVGASIEGAELAGVNFKGADLRDTNLAGIRWQGIRSVAKANLAGVKNAPAGFLEWAKRNGAIFDATGEGN